MEMRVPAVQLFDIFKLPKNCNLEKRLQIQDAAIFAERMYSGISVEDEMKFSDGFLSVVDNNSGNWKCKELSEDTRKKIISLHKQGHRSPKISKLLNLSRSTVARTIRRFKITGGFQSLPRSGRPKKLTSDFQSLIHKFYLENKGISAPSIAAELKAVTDKSVSPQTIRRVLNQVGLQVSHPKGRWPSKSLNDSRPEDQKKRTPLPKMRLL
uniref:Paired domain-containing protein n=1 Tax=Knipowitschia caucasica TaxID=637954 RepID=A0AAV2KQL7_KNICA